MVINTNDCNCVSPVTVFKKTKKSSKFYAVYHSGRKIGEMAPCDLANYLREKHFNLEEEKDLDKLKTWLKEQKKQIKDKF